jgi:hypothetical protein
MSNKYGFVGNKVTQTSKNNKGVFNTKDINTLINNNKWSGIGELIHIETKTTSSPFSTIDFSNIQSTKYNVHLLTYSDVLCTDTQMLSVRIGADDTSFLSASYSYASQYNMANGTDGGLRSTSTNKWFDLYGYNGGGTNETSNGYAYFYNLGDTTSYSYTSSHSIGTEASSGIPIVIFGIGMQTTQQTNNAIRLLAHNGGTINQGNFSLYGIKET